MWDWSTFVLMWILKMTHIKLDSFKDLAWLSIIEKMGKKWWKRCLIIFWFLRPYQIQQGYFQTKWMRYHVFLVNLLQNISEMYDFLGHRLFSFPSLRETSIQCFLIFTSIWIYDCFNHIKYFVQGFIKFENSFWCEITSVRELKKVLNPILSYIVSTVHLWNHIHPVDLTEINGF